MTREVAQLNQRAFERVGGRAWAGLREQFFEISSALLGSAPDCSSELTTIYVKYRTGAPGAGNVHAVAWLKRSSELAVGFALPDGLEHSRLISAPRGINYPGITGYLTIVPGEPVPSEIGEWARMSYQTASTR